MGTSPSEVHKVLGRRLLADGMPLVFDPHKSQGSRFFDARSGREFLDFFGFFASMPLGFNNAGLNDPEWRATLGQWAVHKPSNSDVYTVPFAEFVQTFEEIAVPPEMEHLFFVSGGALAVENAMKVAFDWKSRLNQSRGLKTEAGEVLHLEDAFHGRSGYTLSVTNTDPAKTDLFPKFDWPRVPNPWCSFPLEGQNLANTESRERESLQMMRQILESRSDRIACLLLEPIQSEGGDHHFRREFLQGVRDLADEFDVLLIFDEVQTGLGGTGEMWCYQHFGVIPDIVAFGKKMQTCGIMATQRIDRVAGNCFETSSRINSTWGGNLVDMIRATRILQIYREQNILDNVRQRGTQLLKGVQALQDQHPQSLSNARGRGLFVAFDLPCALQRNNLIELGSDKGVLLLGCGTRSIRFRPTLDIDAATIEQGLEIVDACLSALPGH